MSVFRKLTRDKKFYYTCHFSPASHIYGSRLHCPTITIKQAKAAKNKTKGVMVQSYDKKAEIETTSGKQYILDMYGHLRFLFRLEVRLSYRDLQEYCPASNNGGPV